MPKIPGYTETVLPDADASYLLVDNLETTGKTKPKQTTFISYRKKMIPQSQEFMAGTEIAPFKLASNGSPTIAQIASIANHPGLWRITSGAAANGAYFVYLQGSILLGGGEVAECIFRVNSTTDLVFEGGFLDQTLPTTPTDGAWINIAGTTLSGKTANNGSVSTTSSTYAISTATWYRMKVVVNDSAASVTFYLYNASGTLLWSDTLSTNIPTAAGRETDMGVAACKTTAGSASLIDIDWLAYWNTYLQVR